jgi:putative oxidoreductase
MSFVMAVLRCVLGVLFLGHGAQKVFGSFGGGGPDKTAEAFDSMGLKPGKPMALAAGASEMTGGALLMLGLATPLAATLLSSVMTGAIEAVHGKKGPWVTQGGYEYNLVILASLLTVVGAGPGALSVDHALGIERTGAGWALASVGAGALAGTVMTAAGGRPDAGPEDDVEAA